MGVGGGCLTGCHGSPAHLMALAFCTMLGLKRFQRNTFGSDVVMGAPSLKQQREPDSLGTPFRSNHMVCSFVRGGGREVGSKAF